MPRAARIISCTGIYHIIIRGINQQNIFSSDNDYKKFLHILSKCCRKSACEIYAYCLMSNHIHLLLKEGLEPLATIMKKIGTSYVSYYNWQYNRKGHLFQDRYKSEPVEDETYFLTVLRYIHQNPKKAGITENLDSYPWSSYLEYLEKGTLINTTFSLKIFHQDQDRAIQGFINFHNQANEDKCLDITNGRETLSDKTVSQLILKRYSLDINTLTNTKPETQRKVLKYLKEIKGCSLRQIARLTGLTLYQVRKA
ncbi:MAG: hypothetical protein Kow00103_02290 [Candidatus Caldatribacteriota bacterium]